MRRTQSWSNGPHRQTSWMPRARPSCASAVFMTRPRAVVWSSASAGAGAAASAAGASPSVGWAGASFSLQYDRTISQPRSLQVIPLALWRHVVSGSLANKGANAP